MLWLLCYAALGLVSGFFAGLLGIGGGLIMVPVLSLLFQAQGFEHAHVLHLALGTSMAAIVFSALASVRTHARHAAVDWNLMRTITPGILLGTALGTVLARHIPTRELALFFAAFTLLIALQMALNFKPAPHRQLPGPFGQRAMGLLIGTLSSLVAIGGGALTVPYLIWCNVPAHRAIGTSAAIGLPLAIGGTLGYIANGWNAAPLPPFALGFVYLPALACLLAASMVTAPLGARTTHRLPVATIKRIFSLVLIVLAVKMVGGLLH
ncbi:MAG: sulfite exporter TauE/SafE family protein [Burkholderiaceae bacterium]|nr:MAG: sulfite exporter TauE/SafE family protein [Burkholderiaceae bacterium]